jgi:hypothetical protein
MHLNKTAIGSVDVSRKCDRRNEQSIDTAGFVHRFFGKLNHFSGNKAAVLSFKRWSHFNNRIKSWTGLGKSGFSLSSSTSSQWTTSSNRLRGRVRCNSLQCVLATSNADIIHQAEKQCQTKDSKQNEHYWHHDNTGAQIIARGSIGWIPHCK